MRFLFPRVTSIRQFSVTWMAQQGTIIVLCIKFQKETEGQAKGGRILTRAGNRINKFQSLFYIDNWIKIKQTIAIITITFVASQSKAYFKRKGRNNTIKLILHPENYKDKKTLCKFVQVATILNFIRVVSDYGIGWNPNNPRSFTQSFLTNAARVRPINTWPLHSI